MYLRDRLYASRDGTALDDLDLTFEANFTAEEYASHRIVVELKQGGHDIAVTEANRLEYLQLFVEQRLVGEIRDQVG